MLAQRMAVYVLLCLLNIGLCSRTSAQTGSSVASAEATLLSQQLVSLVPDTQDLPGFVLVRPGDNTPLTDTVDINVPASQYPVGNYVGPKRTDQISRITRCFYSIDGAYYIMAVVTLCQTPALASLTLDSARRGGSRTMTSGSFTSLAPTGDESWVPLQPRNDFILLRAGRVEALVTAGTGPKAAQDGVTRSFPARALQVVADDVVLRIMQQAKLTGVNPRTIHIVVDGKPLSGTVLANRHTTFVPALAFTRALGNQGR